jgi:cobalt-zinc-cadmium efflux system outer membrane protein
MPPVQWLSTFAVAAVFASPAAAGPLTYAAAIALAERSAPSLEATGLKVDAPRAARRAPGRLPDPKLSVGVDNFPVSGPPAGRFNADEMTMARIGIVQEVPNGARRRAEVAAGSAEIGVAEAEATLQQRDVRVATALAWIDLAYAERRLAALDQVVGGLKDLWSAQPASIASGASRPAMGLEPKRLEASFADRRSELVAAMAKARTDLSRWTGDPAPSAAGDAPHYDIDLAALHAALDKNPNLRVSDAAERRAAADVDAARAAARPDLGFDLSYGRRDRVFGDMVSAGVTVSLPLFKSTRQDPVIAARIADHNRVRIEREDRRRMLVAALDSDIADHVMHHDQWRRAVEVFVPTAQERAHLELSSYAAGRAGFDDVRQAVTDLADARLTALEREAMVVRDGARIVLTYGSDQ